MNEENKKHYALTGLEMRMLNPDAKIIKYPELYDCDSVEEIFGNKRKVIILYLLQSDMIGHWTTLFLNQDGINFFDPYGVPVDYELELLSKQRRGRLNQEQDYLKNMLEPYTVIYNNITYQDKGTATCGCYVSHRLHYSHLDDPQYFSIFASTNKRPDEIVSSWCLAKLNNL